MKKLFHWLVGLSCAFSFLLMFNSCEQPDIKSPPAKDTGLTVLGKQSKNPFTSANMKEAIKNVAHRLNAKGGRTACYECIPSTTHNYVRFAPQNPEQLILLHNLGYDLYDVPLDQDVVTQGEYYQDPSLPADAVTYQYTLIPENYGITSSVPYVVLGQAFLFDETAGDEADEPDPWNPDPGDGYCYDEYGQPYVCGTDPRVYLRKNTALPEDLYKKATQALINAGIDLVELYNEAMKLAGLEDEMIGRNSTGGRTQIVPTGTVRVRDNVTTLDVPVRGVTVKARRLFKLDEVLTNANGNFTMNKDFRRRANIVLKFRNPAIKIRGITNAFKVWEYMQVVEREMGRFEDNQLNGIAINLPFVANADTHAAMAWAAAHCINTYAEMQQHSTNNNIIQPYHGMNVWISPAITTAASTPMLRALSNNTDIDNAISYLFPSALGAGRLSIKNWLPDVTLRLQEPGTGGNVRNAADLTHYILS